MVTPLAYHNLDATFHYPRLPRNAAPWRRRLIATSVFQPTTNQPSQRQQELPTVDCPASGSRQRRPDRLPAELLVDGLMVKKGFGNVETIASAGAER